MKGAVKMLTGNNQRGEGRLGLIITLVIIAIAIFVGVKFIPAKITAYEFGDFIEQECRFAATRRDDAQIVVRIMDKAEEMDVPLKKKNLIVRRTKGEMIIKASYEQPLDLKVTTYIYKFDREERAPLF